jgi:lysyl-tRNA synthetase class 2
MEKHKDNIMSGEYEVRRQKITTMVNAGIDPWPAARSVTAQAKEVLEDFQTDPTEKEYALAGRVMASRLHGKTLFFHIQDESGKIQLYVRQDLVGDRLFEYIKNIIDIGDIIWCVGHSFKTKTGEITLRVQDFCLLSKCLHPLPEKFHGLSDIETIYRQRYLDLITNPDSRMRFIKRSIVVQAVRSFLNDHGYIEVETPMLHPIPGGAAAKPFITHHNTLNADLYLRVAPELYLKRLAVGGFERVYEINKSFRNEGISTRHNPEFTMLEFYTAHYDYIWAMTFVEHMLQHVVMKVHGSLQVPFGDVILNFDKPFARMTIHQAVLKFTEFSEQDITAQHIDQTLKKHNISPCHASATLGEKIYLIFEELVEQQLVQPIFITHFPIEVSPLSKRDATDKTVAARFELFIARMELSNAFNELNDPFDQADRFKSQSEARAAGDQEAHHFDADYILALEYGLAPTVGVGIGIDRLTMMLTNAASIKDVILFPALKKRS